MRFEAHLVRRLLLLVLATCIFSVGPGCLRRRFDLCLEETPHPDCPRDAGPDVPPAPDAAVDAPVDDAATVDAPTAAADAFGAEDAP
jgi:hypothetical protein